MKRAACILAVLAACLSGCGRSPQLPVGISRCDAVQSGNGFSITANVRNDSSKPISGLDVMTDFYENFRYQKFTATVQLKAELDPGQSRDVSFAVEGNAAKLQGRAMRCVITHITYLDGTTQDLPPSS